MRSKELVPTAGTVPRTRADEGDLIQSTSLLTLLCTRYFIVVSKLIFRNGELDSSIPYRLNAR